MSERTRATEALQLALFAALGCFAATLALQRWVSGT